MAIRWIDCKSFQRYKIKFFFFLQKVGSLTNVNETECFSTHLTTFAGGFLVLPAPINWNYVFANADFNRNKTIYITVICIYILHLLIMVYARYKDKKDIEKVRYDVFTSKYETVSLQLGVLALEDNRKEDQYCYQIIVFTGNRKNAGTKSRVHFILAGDEDETQVRTFNHSKRQIFQRGQKNSYVMTAEKKMRLIIRDVLSYICFLVLLNVVSYSYRIDYQFKQVDHSRKYLPSSQVRSPSFCLNT